MVSPILMVKRNPVRRKKLSNEAEITCERVASLIMDYLNGELGRETTLAFVEHLSVCPDCIAFLNTYKKTIQSTQSLRYEDIPSETEKRVREFIQKKIEGSSTKR
ncbi:MAG: anti-sigma factor family protein [Ignavibacteriales bacterium]